jgi:putative ABC transport system permease protein
LRPSEREAAAPAASHEWVRQRRRAASFVAISAEALGRYKLRTCLSVLGVVLGVAAVIAMMSVSEGARQEALAQVQLMGLDNIVLRNRGQSAGRPAALVSGDAARLRALLPLATHASALVERYGPVHAASGSRSARVIAVSHEYREIVHLPLASGRFFGALDLSAQAQVCVLGGSLARRLFGFGGAVGSGVRFADRWYVVVGVLADRATDARGIGSIASRDLNEALLLPLSTLLQEPPPAAGGEPVDEVWLRLSDGRRVEEVGRIAAQTLARLHRGAADIEVVVPRELLRQRYRTQRTFGVVVGSVAVLSLLVGGIGIMNIMLASVVERTHEIGIRRAVGARRRDITAQFLAESLLMTLSGGLAGIVVGAGVSWLVTVYAGWATRISLLSILLAIAVSFAVGLSFGIYPASKAAGLPPIDALRFE